MGIGKMAQEGRAPEPYSLSPEDSYGRRELIPKVTPVLYPCTINTHTGKYTHISECNTNNDKIK